MVVNLELLEPGPMPVVPRAAAASGYYETETESPSSANDEPAVKIMFQVT